MKFTFEEAALINNFFEDVNIDDVTKENLINRLINTKNNTDDVELIEIAENTINKLKSMKESSIKNMLHNLPIDINDII